MDVVAETTTDFSSFEWIVITCGIVAFANAFYIGANDVANAFATSVGSRALTLGQALVIAAIFEFGGAVLLGKGVTDTVRKKITSPEEFEDEPEVLMLAMFCALIGATIWLAIATFLALPVSTTHSIIGGVIGVAMAARGNDAVDWEKVTEVVTSWFIAPLLAAGIAMTFYLFTRTFILRSSDSVKRTYVFFPFLFFCVVTVNAFFIIYKGAPGSDLKNIEIGTGVGYSFAIGAGAAILFAIFFMPVMKKKLATMDPIDYYGDELRSRKAEAGEVVHNGPVAVSDQFGREHSFVSNGSQDEVAKAKAAVRAEPVQDNEGKSVAMKVFSKMTTFEHHDVVDDDVFAIHDNAERYDLKSEQAFSFLQVFTAIFDSFAHGANDVANAIGPFAAVVAIYDAESVDSKAEVETWILALGGFGIVVGLATYGSKVIRAIGVKLTKITPTRGFAIELGSALTVVLASRLEIPVSTTQCQVGATLGVGVVDGLKQVNWKLMTKVFLGWVLTVVFSAIVSAGVLAFAAYSPTVVRPQV